MCSGLEFRFSGLSRSDFVPWHWVTVPSSVATASVAEG
jgi:hypothetical protein